MRVSVTRATPSSVIATGTPQASLMNGATKLSCTWIAWCSGGAAPAPAAPTAAAHTAANNASLRMGRPPVWKGISASPGGDARNYASSAAALGMGENPRVALPDGSRSGDGEPAFAARPRSRPRRSTRGRGDGRCRLPRCGRGAADRRRRRPRAGRTGGGRDPARGGVGPRVLCTRPRAGARARAARRRSRR